MAYKRLFIWVEGRDDELFFNIVIKPLFKQRYDQVEVRTYAEKPKEYINNFVKSIEAMQADYIFTTDINSALCVTRRKQNTQKMYRRLEADNIIVIEKEIESWYLAGLEDTGLTEGGLPVLKNTDTLAKEQFEQLMPRRFDSRIDFMIEALKIFSLEIAKRKNRSLKYFVEKYSL